MIDFDTIIERRGTHSYKWDDPGQGRDVIPLWVADMDFPAPPAVTSALSARAANPIYGYTFAPEGLFQAFIRWHLRRNRWRVERDWVVPAPGVVPCLHYAVEAFTREGQGVVVQPPVYGPFFRAVEALGRRLTPNPLIRDGMRYRMDLEGLETLLDGGVGLLILCSPHNPVARVWDPEELLALGNLCRDRGVVIVSDDIHSDLIMPGKTFTPLAALGEDLAANSVTCSSPSKSFNIPGAGSAFAVIPDPEKRDAFRRAAERMGAMDMPNLFSAAAAEAAYREGEEWLEEVKSYIWDNYLFLEDFCRRRLPDLRVHPLEGTYVVWIDFRGLGLSAREMDTALRDARVRPSPGEIFGPGGEGFYRLNIACPRELLRQGLERIAAAFPGTGK